MINYIKAHVFNSSDAAYLLANDEKSTKFAIKLITKKLDKVRMSPASFSPYKIQKYKSHLSYLCQSPKPENYMPVANSKINSAREKGLSKIADIRQRPEFKEMAAKISERRIDKKEIDIEMAKNSTDCIKEMAENLVNRCDEIILDKVANKNCMSRNTVTLLKYFSELKSEPLASKGQEYLDYEINKKTFKDFGNTEICTIEEVNAIKILLNNVKEWANNVKKSYSEMSGH